MRDDTSTNGTTGGAARRYAEIREIGRGGVGRVTLVRDGQIGRDIAMKQLLAPRASGEEVSRFVREAQATGRLEHPNIVPIYDVGVGPDGRVFFTMKYVRGESLRHALRRVRDGEPAAREELGLARLVGIFLQVCNGVAFANAKGYVHRDLKPDNVMLGNFGEVLVADWGLAKDIAGGHGDDPAVRVGASTVRTSDLQTLAGYVYGTPAYMPPEQARGEISRIDQRADVYALGAILYEILTLTAPRSSGSVQETLARAAAGEAIERPERRVAGKTLPWSVPKELAAVAMKALSPEPADRYATAKVLADDVRRYVEGRSVLACPDGLARRAWKVARRHRQKLAAAAAILVVAVTVAAAASAIYRRSTRAGYVADAERLVADARARRDAALADLGPADATYVDEADRVRRLDANRDYRERLNLAVAKYEDALALDPESAGVRTALGDVTMELWRTAEWEDNRELIDLYGREVERVVPGRYTAELAGVATFRLSTNVEGAEAYLFRYVPVGKNRRLVAAPADPETGEAGAPADALAFTDANRLGALPLERPMRPGEYLVVVRRDGFRDLTLPVALPRGGDLALAPALVRDADVPDGFTYVPSFRPKLYGPFPRSKSATFVATDVNAFYIQTREVTFGQYEAFLNDLVATGRAEEAAARVPRDFGFAYMKVEGNAVVSNGAALTPGWRKWPVRGVSWNDAQAYAAWLGAREGRTYRLPTEDEWEAAARGADGRRFSWGEVFWPAAARLTQAYGPAGAAAAAGGEDTVYADVSPFGVVDMAGSVAEWCQDPITGGGLGRAPMAGSGVRTEYAIRGNAWALTPVGLETTFRSSGPADYFHGTIGFRLVAPF